MPTPVLELDALARAAVGNRPPWLGVCAWCLTVIYQPQPDTGWQHVYTGLYLCPRPHPGAPAPVTASPLDHHDPIGQLHAAGLVLPPPTGHHPPARPAPSGSNGPPPPEATLAVPGRSHRHRPHRAGHPS